MPSIKPRTRGKQLVKHRTRLDCQNNETLSAYAHFLGESPRYVLNQSIDTVLARDKEFVSSRAAHTTSFLPGAKSRPRPNAGAVRRSQAPPRPPATGDRRRESLTGGAPCCAESSKRAARVLVLNFPVGLNPGLARILDVIESVFGASRLTGQDPELPISSDHSCRGCAE